MSDKLVTKNGESIEIDSMIDALETAPDKGEILQALRDLRREKVKGAGQTIKRHNLTVRKRLMSFGRR